MKKIKEDRESVNIERNPVLMVVLVVCSIVLCWYSYSLFRVMAGIAFALAIPAVVMSFHTLWMLLNPFARIYDEKAELRQSWFHNKDHYFNDLSSVGEHKGRIFITYTDGEQESLPLFGIKPSHRTLLKEYFSKHISAMREQNRR